MSLSLLSLCWIKRNAAKTPAKIRLEKEELDALMHSKNIKKTKKKPTKKAAKTKNEDDDEIIEKYNLGDYDDEGTVLVLTSLESKQKRL
jgi:hypothetical protein